MEKVLEDAVCAPSAINMQPWEFTMVMGEERLRLSRALMKSYQERKISCAPGNVSPLPQTAQQRRIKSFEGMMPLLQEMGVNMDTFVNEGSLNFYHAPAAAILTFNHAFSQTRLLDMGIAAAYFLLSAHEHGLATCPIGLICAYEDTIKEVLNIREANDVALGIAVGYPDEEAPINRFKSPRDEMSTFVRWFD